MLMTLHTTPNQVKRLAANMHRAASRMRELLTGLTSLTYGHKSTPEICDIREIMVAASETAAAATDNRRVQILARCARANRVAAGARSYEADVLQPDYERSGSDAGRQRGAHWGREKPRLRAGCNIRAGWNSRHGARIPYEVREHLFEPFVTAGKPGGLGLGLALSRQLFSTTAVTCGLNPRLARVLLSGSAKRT